MKYCVYFADSEPFNDEEQATYMGLCLYIATYIAILILHAARKTIGYFLELLITYL